MAAGVKDLHVVVIGAGMGGLATALALAKKGFKNIDLFETASDLGFVGAGIQMAPNMARILDRLGCWEQIFKEATDVKSTSIRDGTTDKEFAHVELPGIQEKYGYPHCVGHRSTLAGSIFEGCQKESSIKFHFATQITEIKEFSPKPIVVAKPRNGEAYSVEADVILAADGIKSVVRPEILRILKHDADIVDTGQAAYRIMLTREQIKSDPDLAELIDLDRVTRWIGEKKHLIAYPVAGKGIYNISTAHPDKNFAEAPTATYTTKGSKEGMMSTFGDFAPRVIKMFDMVPEGEVCEWKLRVHAPLPTWVHGSVALVGDAAHPTLPHLNQGAAQAIEDAGVLSVALSLLPDTTPESINKALLVYEKVRKDRAETLVALAAASGKTLMLGEGAAREERDKAFAALKEKGGAVPDKWADAEVQAMIYGHDCMKITEEKFDEYFKSS